MRVSFSVPFSLSLFDKGANYSTPQLFSSRAEKLEMKLQTVPLRFSSLSRNSLPPQLSFYFIPKPLSNRFLSQLNHLSNLKKPLIEAQQQQRRDAESLLPNGKEVLEFGGDLLFTVWLNSIPEIWTVEGSDTQNPARGVGRGGGMISLDFLSARASASQGEGKDWNRRDLKLQPEEEDQIIVSCIFSFFISAIVG